MPDQITNPFDQSRDVLRQLQKQVSDLSAKLDLECSERRQDVARLQGILEKEDERRRLNMQRFEHILAQEVRKLETPQQRLRYEFGDLRTYVDEAREAQQKEYQDLLTNLRQSQRQLESLTNDVKQGFENQGSALHTGLASERSLREAALQDLEVGLSTVDASLRQDLEAHVRDWKEYKSIMDEDYSSTKSTTKNLVMNVDFLLGKYRRVGALAEGYKALDFRSLRALQSADVGIGVDPPDDN